MVPAFSGLVMNLFAGRVIGKTGTRLAMRLGLIGTSIGTVLLALAGNIWMLGLWLALVGISFSIVNVAMNVEADRIETEGTARIMNRCHGIWALGFLATALLGTGARAIPLEPLLHFAAFLPVAAIGGWWVTRALPDGRNAGAPTRPAWPSLPVLRIVGVAMAGAVAQAGVQNWSVIFMRDSFNAPAWVDTLTIPAFFLTLTLGRLTADKMVERIGAPNVARLQTATAAAGTLLVAFAPNLFVALAGFGLIGYGISAGFPLMVTAAAGLSGRTAAENVAAATFTTGTAMIFAPFLMGLIAEEFGIRLAFAAILPAFLLSYLMAKYLR